MTPASSILEMGLAGSTDKHLSLTSSSLWHFTVRPCSEAITASTAIGGSSSVFSLIAISNTVNLWSAKTRFQYFCFALIFIVSFALDLVLVYLIFYRILNKLTLKMFYFTKGSNNSL